MSGVNSWAFNQLNLISPLSTSPLNGPSGDQERSEFNLSYPISSSALQAQLEQWTNVAFDFNEDLNPTPEDRDAKEDESRMMLGGLGLGDNRRSQFHSALGASRGLLQQPSTLPSTSYGLAQSDNHLAPSSALDPVLSTLFANLPLYAPIAGLDSSLSSSSSPPTVPPTALSQPSAKSSTKKRGSTASGSATAGNIATGSLDDGEDQFPPLVLGDDEAKNAIAIEEDKRRRNTAASARFRIKKKQREQALESTAKELRDKVEKLERENEALKTENGWLRGIIVEKAKKEEIALAAHAGESAEGPDKKRARVELA